MNNYFYLDQQHNQQGPVAANRLTDYGVGPASLVWTQGMENWAPAGTIPELKVYFDQTTSSFGKEFTNEPHAQQTNFGTNTNADFNIPHGNGFTPHNHPFCSTPSDNRPPYPDTHMTMAILSTICCCIPFGIVAIVKASQVSNLFAQGLYDAAYLAADDARKWSIISFVCGLVSMGTYGLFALL